MSSVSKSWSFSSFAWIDTYKCKQNADNRHSPLFFHQGGSQGQVEFSPGTLVNLGEHVGSSLGFPHVPMTRTISTDACEGRILKLRVHCPCLTETGQCHSRIPKNRGGNTGCGKVWEDTENLLVSRAEMTPWKKCGCPESSVRSVPASALEPNTKSSFKSSTEV